MKPTPLLLLVTLTCATAWAQETQPENIYPEGNFEGEVQLLAPYPSPFTTDPMTAVEGALYIEPGNYKDLDLNVSLETESGSKFVRYHAPAGFKGILRTYIALRLPDPAMPNLRISMCWRLKDFAKEEGAPEWASAQNDPTFILADGTRKVVHGTFRLRGDTGGEWVELEKIVPIPSGAKMVVMMPGLYACSGTLEIDDLKMYPTE